MSVECFLDTNILVYAVSSTKADAAKKRTALELLERHDFGLSAQVLQEFFVTATRKMERPLSVESTLALLDELRHFPTVVIDYPLIVAAIEVSIRYGISYWDAAIVSAANSLDAKTLYSEDLNHGQRYGATTVCNPFLESGDPNEIHEPPTRRYGSD